MSRKFAVAKQNPVEKASVSENVENKNALLKPEAVPSHLAGEALAKYLSIHTRAVSGGIVSVKELLEQNAANLRLLQQPQVVHQPRVEFKLASDPEIPMPDGVSTTPDFPSQEKKNESTPDVPSDEKKVDPKYSLVCCELVRRLILRPPNSSDSLTTDIIRIYHNPEILLALDVFAQDEINFITRQFLHEDVTWVQTRSDSPPFVETKGAICGEAGLERCINRLLRVFSLQGKKVRARGELARGLVGYVNRLADEDFFKDTDIATIILFLKDVGGGRLDFFELGFCTNPKEGAAMLLPPNISWTDLQAGQELGARLALVLRVYDVE